MSYPQPPDVPPPPIDPWFKLEAVVVCDKYDDFLRHTLPQNKFLFDKMVVVTSFEDKRTRKLCEFYHVECIATDCLRSRHGVFCKADGINEGLTRLGMQDWVVHLDADVWLPPQTRILIQRMNLAKRMVYGIDRFIVKGPQAWEQFLELPKLQHEDGAWIHLDAFPLGTRFMQTQFGGYIPIGFFQIWNPEVSGVKTYPTGNRDAGSTDMRFALQWPRGLRSFLPEIVGYHLESVDSAKEANWDGRKTAQFSLL
jgi:hypothetical protein